MRHKQVKMFIRQAVDRFARIYGYQPCTLRYRAAQLGNRSCILIEIYRIARYRGQLVFFHVPPLGENDFASPTIHMMVPLIEGRTYSVRDGASQYINVLSDMPDCGACTEWPLHSSFGTDTFQMFPFGGQNRIGMNYHTQMSLISLKRSPRRNRRPLPIVPLLWAITDNKIVSRK